MQIEALVLSLKLTKVLEIYIIFNLIGVYGPVILTLKSTQAPLDAFEMYDFGKIWKMKHLLLRSKCSIFHNFKTIEM